MRYEIRDSYLASNIPYLPVSRIPNLDYLAIMKWKTLSSKYLFDDKNLWFKVRKEVCQAPDGRIIDPYYVYEFPEWATAVALTEDNKVILVKQYRHAIGEISIELPGGCVDDIHK